MSRDRYRIVSPNRTYNNFGTIEKQIDNIDEHEGYTKSEIDAMMAEKADTSDVESALEDKVDKEEGKGLSTNDYTDADKAMLAEHDTEIGELQAAVDNKVDKETGKGLSTNDFSDGWKTQISSNTNRIGDAEDRITQTESDINTLQSVVDTLETNKADKTALEQETQDRLDAESQLQGQIDDKADISSLDDYIKKDDIQDDGAIQLGPNGLRVKVDGQTIVIANGKLKAIVQGGSGGYPPDEETLELTEDNKMKVKHDDTLVIGDNGLRVHVDDDTIGINEDEELYVKGGSGGGVEIVDNYPDPSTAKEKTIYLKNKRKVGEYDSIDKPTTGTIHYFKLANYVGIPTSMTYNEETGWYRLEIGGEEYGVHFIFNIPISMMDINYFQSTEYQSLLLAVDTPEEAEYYVMMGGTNVEANNLVIPMGVELEDIPHYCYMKLNPEAAGSIELNPENNSYIRNRTEYFLNISFSSCWNQVFEQLLKEDPFFIKADGLQDANFIMDNTKITRNDIGGGLYEYAPYAIAVKINDNIYDSMAIVRNNNNVKSWEIIDYKAIEAFTFDTIHYPATDPIPVTLGYMKDMMTELEERYGARAIEIYDNYTTVDDCIVPTCTYDDLILFDTLGTTNRDIRLTVYAENISLNFRVVAIYKDQDRIIITAMGKDYEILYTVNLEQMTVTSSVIKFNV